MHDPKYAVIKWENWLALTEQLEKQFGVMLHEYVGLLPDAEVIRHQDITAAPIFHHYSSQLKGLVELAEAAGVPVKRDDLLGIADHFHEAAMLAEDNPYKKLPD